MADKIATCCYCGTRAALVLRGRDRHELSCSACGAPLHEMKALPIRPAPAPVNAPAKCKAATSKTRRKPVKRRKKMRKFSPMRAFRKAMDEVWDAVEDVFD